MEFLVNLLFGFWLARQSNTRLAIVAGLAGLGCIAGIWRYGHADVGASFATVHYGFSRALYGFTFGMLLHRASNDRAPRSTAFALLLPLVLFAVLAIPEPGIGRRWFDTIVIFAVFPGLVWMGNGIELPRWGAHAAGLLGDVSYPLYSIHNPIVLAGILVATKLGIGVLPATTVFILGTLTVSVIIVHVYDLPIRTRIAAWLQIRRSSPPQEL